jgi:hypothetical protein
LKNSGDVVFGAGKRDSLVFVALRLVVSRCCITGHNIIGEQKPSVRGFLFILSNEYTIVFISDSSFNDARHCKAASHNGRNKD